MIEIETIKVRTIKIQGISKSDFELRTFFDNEDNEDSLGITFRKDSLIGEKLNATEKEVFLKGMIDLMVKKFPRNGKLKVVL